MSSSSSSIYFDPFQQMNINVVKSEPKEKITYTSVPLIPSSDKEHVVADVSQAYRATLSGMQALFPLDKFLGSDFVGLTTLSYIGIGFANMMQAQKDLAHHTAFKDSSSTITSKIQLVQSGFLSIASLATAPGRGMKGIIDMIGAVRHSTVALSTSLSLAISIFSIAGTLFFSLYYLLKMVEEGKKMFHWIQGKSLREQLLLASNPHQIFLDEVKKEMRGCAFTSKDYQALAISQGNLWIQNTASFSQTFKQSQTPFLLLLDSDPQLIDRLLGQPPFQLTKEGNLLRLGEHLMREHSRQKCEAKWRVQLGSQTVDALKNQDMTTFYSHLQGATILPAFLRFLIPTIGVGVTIATAFMTGGVALAIIFAVWAVTAILSIALEDGKLLHHRLLSSQTTSHDVRFIAFAMTLSVIATSALLTLTILSGGALCCLGGTLIALGWLALNAREAWLLKQQRDRTPLASKALS
ncbi:MAG: hypothetical protein QRY72_01700 [Candidatus Rhabdochlamydia sp.]